MEGNRRSLALCALTVSELARGLENGSFSSEAVTDAYLENIALQNSTLNVFLEVFGDTAREEARASDRRRREGKPLSRLDGVPFAVKDNLCVEGRLCTCASRMLENYRSPYTATAVRRLQEAGMPLLGRVNLDEFAMGSSTETSFFGPSRNPWDASRVPGGSSGGCAAAVAAGMTPVALGSDTGGSIRQPAALCGVAGIKPAYGTVSRYGLVAMASSFDQIGPLCKTCGDAALVMKLLAGGDPRDMTANPSLAADFTSELERPLENVMIALPQEAFGQGLDADVERAVRTAAEAFRRLGAEIETVSLPSLPLGLSAYLVLSCAEAGSNLARYDGVRYGHRAPAEEIHQLYRESRREGFGMEVKRRILLGAYSLTEEHRVESYDRAVQARALLQKELERVLGSADALLFPTTATTAWPIGEKQDDPAQMYLSDLYSVPANLAGLPALSLPCGLSGEGLPMGMTLMGGRESLPLLFRLAARYEAACPLPRGRHPYERLTAVGQEGAQA